MDRVLKAVLISNLAVAQLSFASPQAKDILATQPASGSKAANTMNSLPPLPRGKSTVIGGAIRKVDPVRDQLVLNVFEGKPIKIFFDERTQVFRDGKRIALLDLRPEDHASIETMLDGTNVFAVSIHILSKSPEGECQGQVLAYNPATGELEVNDTLLRQPVKLRVPGGAPIDYVGQAGAHRNTSSAALTAGTLVSVKFTPGSEGRPVVSQISVLATPGSTFVFSGKITFLDLHAKLMAVVDPRDEHSYRISFDPERFPISRDLREGANVTVSASFNGTDYIAQQVTLD